MTNLYQRDPLQLANGILKYLLGAYDFYKIIKENGSSQLFHLIFMEI